MKQSTSGMVNVVLQVFTRSDHFKKEEALKVKESLKDRLLAVYSLQWLVRKSENRVWYSRNAYYWGSQ